MLELVRGLADAGVSMELVKSALPNSKLLQVDGNCAGPDELWAAIQEQHGRSDANRKRWRLEDPIEDGASTWVLNNNWGSNTREYFAQLLARAPIGLAVHEEGETPAPRVGGTLGPHEEPRSDQTS
jgi:hypothetical protein